LALLAEFQDDEAAATRLTRALRDGQPLEHAAECIRREHAEAADHEKIRAGLEADGITITDELPPGASMLAHLLHDGEPVTTVTHGQCPGRGAFFTSWDIRNPAHYCADPVAHGHSSRYSVPLTADGAGTSGAARDGAYPSPPHPGPPDPGRRIVVQGNRAWAAAAEVRKRWLHGQLFTRRTASPEIARFIARQLLTMPAALRSSLASAHSTELFSEITGRQAHLALKSCDSSPAAQLPLLMLGPVVVAYEHEMTGESGKATWRPERYSPCPRQDAGRYLAFLASLGYQLSGIEQAVADGTPYTGDTPPGDALTDGGDPAGPGTGDDSAAGETSGVPGSSIPPDSSPDNADDQGQAVA